MTKDRVITIVTAVLSLLVIPLLGWAIKLESDRAVLSEKVTQLESALEKKVEADAFKVRKDNVEKKFADLKREVDVAKGIKDGVEANKGILGRMEERINGIKSTLSEIKELLRPVRVPR